MAAARFVFFYEQKKSNKAGVLYGGEPLDSRKRRIIQLLGISADEALRAKPSRHKAIENQYPMLDAGYTRNALANCVAPRIG